MYELKIVYVAGKLYRGIVNLGLRSVNRRDKRALQELTGNLDHAEAMRETAEELLSRAEKLEDVANQQYHDRVVLVNTAYNLLSNLRDDIVVATVCTDIATKEI